MDQAVRAASQTPTHRPEPMAPIAAAERIGLVQYFAPDPDAPPAAGAQPAAGVAPVYAWHVFAEGLPMASRRPDLRIAPVAATSHSSFVKSQHAGGTGWSPLHRNAHWIALVCSRWEAQR